VRGAGRHCVDVEPRTRNAWRMPAPPLSRLSDSEADATRERYEAEVLRRNAEFVKLGELGSTVGSCRP
jgi:hypothetical protein